MIVRLRLRQSRQGYNLIVLLIGITLACGGSQRNTGPTTPTKTPLPTFTMTPTLQLLPTVGHTAFPTNSPTPIPPIDTPTSTTLPVSSATPTASATPTETSPPTNTPLPAPTDTPTVTPTPEPIITYVLATAQREFNCEFTYIYGSVKNANNLGLPNVEVRALGIHDTTGLEFITRTDAEGNYEIFHIPLNDLLAAQWAVMLMENGREVSERFHWASTPVCESDDTGHSQVLRLDWKLIE